MDGYDGELWTLLLAHLESQHTHVLVDVQLPRPVEVEDGVEGAGMAVKEVLVLNQVVVRHQTHHLLMALNSGKVAKSEKGF